jgi:hypothetical protein
MNQESFLGMPDGADYIKTWDVARQNLHGCHIVHAWQIAEINRGQSPRFCIPLPMALSIHYGIVIHQRAVVWFDCCFELVGASAWIGPHEYSWLASDEARTEILDA